MSLRMDFIWDEKSKGSGGSRKEDGGNRHHRSTERSDPKSPDRPVGSYKAPRAPRVCASCQWARGSIPWEWLQSRRVIAGPGSPILIGNSRAVPAEHARNLAERTDAKMLTRPWHPFKSCSRFHPDPKMDEPGSWVINQALLQYRTLTAFESPSSTRLSASRPLSWTAWRTSKDSVG